MWIDCLENRKLVNLDQIQSFDIVRRGNTPSDAYDVKIQYVNDTEDIIFTGTFDECESKHKAIQQQIAILETEVIATIRVLSQNIALSTMKPNAPTFKPDMEVPKPDLESNLPEGMAADVKDQETPYIRRVMLYVVTANHPKRNNSEDMRGTKGSLVSIKDVIRTIARIRDGDMKDNIPVWYRYSNDDIEYSISKNMARDAELKQMANNEGFVNLIE